MKSPNRSLVPALALAFAGALTSAALGSPAPRIVDLMAPDGTPLKATYFAAAEPGPGLLLLHQCNRQRKTWDELAAELAARGIHVLTLDYRGYGESGGARFLDLPQLDQLRTQSSLWPGDVEAAFAYLRSQPGVSGDIAGAGGASCGVNQSIQLARRHPEVRSLALLSGNTDREGRQYLRSSPGLPLFLSAAQDDGAVVELMGWLDTLSGNPHNQFVRYAVAGHGTDMFAAQKELPGLVVRWFEATLLHPGQALPARPPRGPSPPGVRLLDLLDGPGGAREAGRFLDELRGSDPEAFRRSEAIVNQIGYERLQASEAREAIRVFELNTAAFPQSPNTWDSLSDAYLADGQPLPARINAEKALQALAADTADPEERKNAIRQSAEDKVRKLGASSGEVR